MLEEIARYGQIMVIFLIHEVIIFIYIIMDLFCHVILFKFYFISSCVMLGK